MNTTCHRRRGAVMNTTCHRRRGAGSINDAATHGDGQKAEIICLCDAKKSLVDDMVHLAMMFSCKTS